MQEISFIPFRDLMLWIVWNANIFVEKNKMKFFHWVFLWLCTWYSRYDYPYWYISRLYRNDSKTVEFLWTWIMMLELGLTF